MILRRVVAGLYAGTLVNAIHMAIILLAGREASASLFASHWIAAATFHVAVAVACAGIADNRLWSAVVFLFPVTTAAGHSLERLGGMEGILVGIAGAALIGAVWTRFTTRRGAPFASAAAGAAAGGLIPWMHVILAFRVERWVVLALAALIFAAGALAAAFAGRPRGDSVPTMTWSAVRLAASACLGLLALPFALRDYAIASPDSSPSSGPSAVLIVLDTVRADHLELYGYERETMPALTRFARERAIVVEHAVANGPSSLPTHASLFTGLYPHRHGAHKPFLNDPNPPAYGYRLRPSIPTLASHLAEAGYWTVGISANAGPLAPAFGLGRGFDVYVAVESPRDEFAALSPWTDERLQTVWLERIALELSDLLPFTRDYLLGVPYRPAGEITDQAIQAIDRAGDGSLFLFVNYMDAHSPYFPPREYMDRFPGRSASLLTSGFEKHRWHAIVDGGAELTDQERAHYTSLYDSELAYLDSELGRLLQRLQQRSDFDDLLVIVTSDHGDAFGDHGDLEHSNSLYDEITRVPLIIKPAATAEQADAIGSTVSGMVESVDLFPTILEHAGIPVPEGIDGMPWGTGRTHAFGWLYPTPGHDAVELRSARSGGWKLVESSSGTVELFHLERDPEETLDLSVAEGRIRDDLMKVLADAQSETDRADAPPQPELSKGLMDQLRALGYVN